LNIAIVSKYPPLSEGISDYGRHVAASLAKRREVDKLTVLADANEWALTKVQDGVQIRRIWRQNELSLLPRLVGEILRLKPDAIWFNASLTMFGLSVAAASGFVLPAVCRRLGIRSVVTLHELPSGPLGALGVNSGVRSRAAVASVIRLLREADVLCVTIDGFRRKLDPECSHANRIVHLPLCGYDEPGQEPFEGSPTALVMTSLAPHKGIENLLDAFRLARRTVATARLVIAGIEHPRFPGYATTLQREISGLAGVTWLGTVADDEVRAVMRQAHVVVAPYRVATGSSATIHRAIALGRPIIATDLPEFRAMALEEDLLLEFVPPESPRHLARALETFWTQSTRRDAVAQHNLLSARRNSLASTTDAYLRLLGGRATRFEPARARQAASGTG
jgi:glycosyltransferase involved in cell wall biosynthesis